MPREGDLFEEINKLLGSMYVGSEMLMDPEKDIWQVVIRGQERAGTCRCRLTRKS